MIWWKFFFFKQKPAYEFSACLVGSEMCIRDRGNTSNPTEVIFTVIYIDEIEPVITSSGSIYIEENSGEIQEVYTVTALDNVGVTSYLIGGIAVSYTHLTLPTKRIV